MNQYERARLIARVKRMEQIFDEILAAKAADEDSFLEDPDIKEKFAELMDYYDHGQWLQDYESYEQGELPAGLKRGVLSQDAVYDLLSEILQDLIEE